MSLYSGAFSENVASLRIQEKLGFRRDGGNMLLFADRATENFRMSARA